MASAVAGRTLEEWDVIDFVRPCVLTICINVRRATRMKPAAICRIPLAMPLLQMTLLVRYDLTATAAPRQERSTFRRNERLPRADRPSRARLREQETIGYHRRNRQSSRQKH